MSESEPIIVFVARVDSEKDLELESHKDWLAKMVHLHALEFDQITSFDHREFTFVRGSETPLTEDEEVLTYFSQLLEERREKNCPLIVAIHDWDGLTSNKMAFVELFQYGAEHESGIRLHVLPRDSDNYVDVSIDEVCSVLMKEINPYKEKDILSKTTTIFIRELKMAYQWARVRHLPEAQQLKQEAGPGMDILSYLSSGRLEAKEAQQTREVLLAHMSDDSSGYSGQSDC